MMHTLYRQAVEPRTQMQRAKFHSKWFPIEKHYKENFNSNMQFLPKNLLFNHLFALMLFQMYCVLWNTKEEILKNVGSQFW